MPSQFSVIRILRSSASSNSLKQEAEDSTVVMVDELTDISISKQDLGGKELPGATITIFDKDGNVATTVDGTECSWVSSDTPHEIKGLPAGSYVLHEVVAPEGYTVTTDINFTINEDGTVTVTDENGNPVDVEELVLTDAPTEVKFSKTDMGGKELPGAKIVVYDEKGEIAKTVLMPGDPLRAKFIAENFLENAKLVNKVRNDRASCAL